MVEAAQRGDARALERLTTILLPRTRNLVRYLIRLDYDVDDIAQEALVAIMRGLATYRGEGTLQSWCDRVVARTTFAWLRKRNLDLERAQQLRAETNANDPPDSLGTDEYVARRQMIEQLDTLPLHQRHALVLHHVLGLSVQEIAAEVGASIETVRSRLRLGKQKLLQRFGSSSQREVV